MTGLLCGGGDDVVRVNLPAPQTLDLARIPIEDNDYTDIKPVREAFGTA